MPKRKKRRTVQMPEARRILLDEELKKLVDMDDVVNDALDRVENHGIIFIDEIDKIAGRARHGDRPRRLARGGAARPAADRRGVDVQTRYGYVRTDHVLFVAAGAFHVSKPSDLIPELQGRFPIRVELKPLTEADFVRIMTEPENALTKQYAALVAAEGAELDFTDRRHRRDRPHRLAGERPDGEHRRPPAAHRDDHAARGGAVRAARLPPPEDRVRSGRRSGLDSRRSWMTTICGATSSELEAALNAARTAALAAGQLLRPEAGRIHPVEAKGDGSPVTVLDLEADRIIQTLLRRAFPTIAIVSEESSSPDAAGASRFWLIDPLDGTRDFAAGSSEFAVHIALVIDGQPVVSVVHQPASGALFEAVAGEGAFRADGLGRARLGVSSRSQLDELRIGTSRRSPGERLTRLLADSPLGGRAVPQGASLKLTAVATGELDGTLCLHDREKIWDSGAPGLIITEAGGRISDVDSHPLIYGGPDSVHHRGIVTSNGRCHEALCALAARYWPA